MKIGPWDLDRTHCFNCLDGLRHLPDNCLDCVVTSPPYWGQRAGVGLGSEEDPREYIADLVTILAEAMRCLRPYGTLWLNLCDSYNTPINWRPEDYVHSTLGADGTGLAASNSAYTKKRGRRRAFLREDVPWLQYGNLLAIPMRVILGLCDRGFYYRGEVIWTKRKALPEGRCRRPHRKHEGIYLFAMSDRHSFCTRPPVGSVWELLQTPNRTPHESAFPFELPCNAIKAAGINGPGVVCDPFMGSGTTGRAAMSLGHSFIGFEIDTEMCDLANRECQQYGG